MESALMMRRNNHINTGLLRFSRQIVVILIILTAFYGVILAFQFASVNAGLRAETNLAAINLIEKGYIGNPYKAITGPTAHVPPGLVGIIAVVYWAFDPVASSACNVILSLISALMYVIGQYFVLKILDIRKCPPGSYALLSALFVLTVPNIFMSVVQFRQWDQPYAAAMLAGAWLLNERRKAFGSSQGAVVTIAALTVVGSLFSAAILPALILITVMMVCGISAGKPRKMAALAGVLVIVMGMLPWAIRNKVELHRFILTRSNFPLEFALGNMPGANGGLTGPMDEFVKEHHPFWSPQAALEMANIGEAAFMDNLATLAIDHVKSNPYRFAELTVMRVRYLLFPSIAMVDWHPLLNVSILWGLLAAFAFMHLLSLAAAAIVDWAMFVEGVIFTVIPLVPYVLTHVEYRYIYIIEFPSILLITLAATKVYEVVFPRPCRSTNLPAIGRNP
jgi:hypothetical protein